MYLLQVNRAGDIYKDDNGAVLVPEFQSVLQAEGLGQIGLKWVALVCDYESHTDTLLKAKEEKLSIRI